MRKAIDVANFLLELFKFDEEGLSNLKLNKLLYYAQGCYYQRFSKFLFDDEIEAWQFGPVVPEVYKKFQPCGRNSIVVPSDLEISLTDEEEELLIDVAREYGKFSASGLVSMTHRKGTPWEQINRSYEKPIIPKKLIAEYFLKEEKKLEPLKLSFSEDDFIGYRDDDGYLVLPGEYDE